MIVKSDITVFLPTAEKINTETWILYEGVHIAHQY
jgi:hypothetical protein